MCSGKPVTNYADKAVLRPFSCENSAKTCVFDAFLCTGMPVWGEKVIALLAILAVSSQLSALSYGQGGVITRASVVGLKFIEGQPQILRLTTPKLKDVWGPVRSE